MGVCNYKELKEHVGHRLECVQYGESVNIANVAIECLDCNEVLVDYDNCESDYSKIVKEDVIAIVQGSGLEVDLNEEQLEMVITKVMYYDNTSYNELILDVVNEVLESTEG